MKTKTLTQLSLEELAAIHLDIYGTHVADGYMVSGIRGLVTEIRSARLRDRTRIFSPLYGAFALLDQIGSIYINETLPACPNDKASGVKKALYYFGGMPFDTDQMTALYGLRNALVHDGGLVTRGLCKKGVWKGPFHRFILGSKDEELVKLPARPWDGDFTTLAPDNTTAINQDALTDLAIAAVHRAKTLLDAGSLGIKVEGGKIELYSRFLFHFPSEPPRPLGQNLR